MSAGSFWGHLGKTKAVMCRCLRATRWDLYQEAMQICVDASCASTVQARVCKRYIVGCLKRVEHMCARDVKYGMCSFERCPVEI